MIDSYTQTGKGRLFLKRNNPNTCNKYAYNGCVSVSGVSTSFGTPTSIYCPSESRYDEFEVVASIRSTSTERPTLTLKSYLPMNRRSTFESLVKSTCSFDLQLHYGDCSSPSEFAQFNRMFLFKNAIITDYSLSDLVASSPDNRALVEETLTVSVDSYTSIVNTKPVITANLYGTDGGTPFRVTEILNNTQLCDDCDDSCCFAVLSCVRDIDDCINSRMQLKLICGGSETIIPLECLPNTFDTRMLSTSKYLYITAGTQIFRFELEDILAFQSTISNLSCVEVTTTIDNCGDTNAISTPDCWADANVTFTGIYHDGTYLYGITTGSLIKFDDSCAHVVVETYASTPVAISGEPDDDVFYVALTNGTIYKYIGGIKTLTLNVTTGTPTSLYVIDKDNVIIGTSTGLYRICYTECLYKALGGCVRSIAAYDDDVIYIAVEYLLSSQIYLSVDGGFSVAALTDDPYIPGNYIGKTITEVAVCSSDPHKYLAIGIDRMLGCNNFPTCSVTETGFLLYGTA